MRRMQLLCQLHNNELPRVQGGLGGQSGIPGAPGALVVRDSLLFPMRLQGEHIRNARGRHEHHTCPKAFSHKRNTALGP